MNFGISTQVFRRQQVSVDRLDSLRKAGYEHIELFCNRPHFDFHDRALQRDIGRWFKENSLSAPSLHLPFVEHIGKQKTWISPLDSDRRLREAAMDEIKRALELTDQVAPDYVVMHLGNPGEEFHPAIFDHAYAAIAQIRSFAGVRVMVENIPNEISTIERINEFKAAAGIHDIGICYDTGHGFLQEVSDGFEYILATHLHDNNGEKDEHLWPFEGKIDWPALIEKLVMAQYGGLFVFEARPKDGDAGLSGELKKSRETQDRLEELWAEAQDSIEKFRLKYELSNEEPQS